MLNMELAHNVSHILPNLLRQRAIVEPMLHCSTRIGPQWGHLVSTIFEMHPLQALTTTPDDEHINIKGVFFSVPGVCAK